LENIFTAFYWVSGFSFLFSIIAICGAFVCKNTVIADESIVLLFVGILATIVVVSNYMQVSNIERKVDGFSKSMEYKIADYDLSISAVFEQLYGILKLNKGLTENALRHFIQAIEYLNMSSHKDPLDGIISCIKKLKEWKHKNHHKGYIFRK
jgi:hypothetical protein